MKKWLDVCLVWGGGDILEVVVDVLYDVFKLSWWENVIKICVLIFDVFLYGLSLNGDIFLEGCLVGLDFMVMVCEFV